MKFVRWEFLLLDYNIDVVPVLSADYKCSLSSELIAKAIKYHRMTAVYNSLDIALNQRN